MLAEAVAGTNSLSTSLQFPDIVEFCEAMANAGKTVIVAALDGTFQRKVRPGPGLGWGREGEGPQWAQGSIETSAWRGVICCRRRRLGRGTQGVALGEARSGPTLLAPVLGSKGVKRTWQVAEHFPPHGSQAFGAILNLVPLAESVVKLTAVCMECFREAAYTKRLGLEKEVAPALCCGPAWEGGTVGRAGQLLPQVPPSSHPCLPGCQVEVIGGADKYHSVCRLCYFKKSSVQPAGQDNKENCPALGRAGEAAAVRKLFAPQQVLQCSPTN